jgi:hypothetical protein
MLADFGVGNSFASAGMVVGSSAYQAPEALDDSYGSNKEADCWMSHRRRTSGHSE